MRHDLQHDERRAADVVQVEFPQEQDHLRKTFAVLGFVSNVNDEGHDLTCSGVQHIAKATMMMTTVLVALFLFSCPLLLLLLLFLSLAGPGPCVAAEPRHSRSSMFM